MQLAKKRIAYICPRPPVDEAAKACQQIMAEISDIEIHAISTLQNLFYLLSHPEWHADFIVIDIEECYALDGVNMWELVGSLKTLNKLQMATLGKKPISFIAGINDTTPIDLIRQAKQCQDFVTLNPILGGSFTYEMCLDSVRHYSNWDWTLPPCIAEMLKPKKIKKSKPSPSKLTTRQEQIYKLLTTRGASNKQIARTLNISESTVKLHLSAILKKYDCSNRTELSITKKVLA